MKHLILSIVGVALLIAGVLMATALWPRPPSVELPGLPTSYPTLSAFTRLQAPDMTPTCGLDPAQTIPETMGSGVTLLDVDGDGTLEIFLANGATLDAPTDGPGCRLFKLHDAVWVDETAEAGIDLHRWATSATPFDLEGDGDTDLLVTCIGPNVLLRNDGGVFADTSTHAGIGDPGWCTGAAAGDVDGDGWTDLYIVNYLNWNFDAPLPPLGSFMSIDVLAGPKGMEAQTDRLLLNNRDGTFRDVTVASGVASLTPGYGMNAAITDFNGDGRQDILVGNDTSPNMLLAHDVDSVVGATKLIDIAPSNGLATNADGGAQATMGMAIGDMNADGRPDIFSTNFSMDTNTLHLSTPDGFFVDRTQAWGLGLHSRPYLGWTTRLLDLDGDGDEDLYALNGHVYPQATFDSMDSDYAQQVLLLVRHGDRFLRADSPADSWAATAAVHRAGALGVIQAHDSAPVLVTTPCNEPMQVIGLPPEAMQRIRTLQLLDDRAGIGNREGHGAHLQIDDGTRVHHRWVTTSSAYQAADAPQVHLTPSPGAQTLDVLVNWADAPATRHRLDLRVAPEGIQTVRRSAGFPVEH